MNSNVRPLEPAGMENIHYLLRAWNDCVPPRRNDDKERGGALQEYLAQLGDA